MLSKYSAQGKVSVGLGILALIIARLFISVPADVFESLAWMFIVAGVALCIRGSISHFSHKGYQLSERARWLLVLPAALATYAGIAILVFWISGLAFDLAVRLLAAKLSSYPFVAAQLFLTSVAGSYCFVLVGARTAPNQNLTCARSSIIRSISVSRVLAIGYICFSGYVLYDFTAMFTFGMAGDVWSWSIWWFFIPWLSGVVGAIVACAKVGRHVRDPKIQK